MESCYVEFVIYLRRELMDSYLMKMAVNKSGDVIFIDEGE